MTVHRAPSPARLTGMALVGLFAASIALVMFGGGLARDTRWRESSRSW